MSYTQITAHIIDQTVQLANLPRLASGSADVLQIRCDFCDLWAGYAKTAVFYIDEAEVYHRQLNGDTVTVPHEVLAKPGIFFFGVMGVADNTRTTEAVPLNIVQGAITMASAETVPAPDIYRQLLLSYATKQNKLDWVTDEDLDAMFAGTYLAEEDEPTGDENAADDLPPVIVTVTRNEDGSLSASHTSNYIYEYALQGGLVYLYNEDAAAGDLHALVHCTATVAHFAKCLIGDIGLYSFYLIDEHGGVENKPGATSCMVGNNPPTIETVGAVGCLYMVNDTHGTLYKCIAVNDDDNGTPVSFLWAKVDQNCVTTVAQELTDGEKAQARQNIGAAAVGETIDLVQTIGDSTTAAMSQKAVTDNFLHPVDSLNAVTEGLTDANAFPDNTIYYVINNDNAQIANFPPAKTGALLTFGSPHSKNGATQMFVTHEGVIFTRTKLNNAYTAWKRVSDDARIEAVIKSNCVTTTEQELTDGEKAQARQNIGAAAVGETIDLVQTIGDSTTAAMSQKAVTDNFLHPVDSLNAVTEGLTDANAFPDNTIYYVINNDNAQIANFPPAKTGALLTFGSPHSKNGATQMFVTHEGVIFTRTKLNNAYTAWKRVSDDARIEAVIKSNKDIGIKTGARAIITTAQAAPLDNADTYPANRLYTFNLATAAVSNLPALKGTMMTFCWIESSSNGLAQIFVANDGVLSVRIKWDGVWTAWETIATKSSVDAAIDETKAKYIDQYVSLAMFEKFGVVGDSFASGSIYKEDGSSGTYYPLSWGQIMARKLGTTCTNFSEGGLSTRTWLTSSKGLTLLESSTPQNIYYLMLGINDQAASNPIPIGTASDITNENADTFYGNYGKIIRAIQTKAPKAKLIISTMAHRSNDRYPAYNAAIETIAAHFGIPCVKQHENAFFNSDFYQSNMVNNHPTAPVYSGMANALQKMFEDAVRDNVAYFNDYIG